MEGGHSPPPFFMGTASGMGGAYGASEQEMRCKARSGGGSSSSDGGGCDTALMPGPRVRLPRGASFIQPAALRGSERAVSQRGEGRGTRKDEAADKKNTRVSTWVHCKQTTRRKPRGSKSL